MRYLKIFENFEESGKLKAGMVIENGYYTNNGTFVIQTNEGEFEIGCAGGANVVVSGDSNKGKIVNVDNQFTIITIELEGGEKIVIEDETGGEGLEIYEVEQSEDNTESEKNLNKSDVKSWVAVSEKLPTIEDNGQKVLIYRIMNKNQESLAISIHDTNMVKHCDPNETWWMELPKPPFL